MDYKLQIVGVQSHLHRKGSPDKKPISEPEDGNFFTLEVDDGTARSLNAMEQGEAPVSLSVGGRKTIQNSVFGSIKIVVLSKRLNLLMPFGLLAILVAKLSGDNGWVFFLSLLGIIPLAERLGYITEQLAFYTGPTVGGLLNATFGNATELIVSFYALKNGMMHVVQRSLLGSILSNMLLVLGSAFFFGGLVVKEQVFDKETATVNSGVLLMAVMCLLLPVVLHSTHTEVHSGKSELALSRFSSCVMLIAYAASLIFQLKTHKNIYIPLKNQEVSQNRENSGDNDDDDEPEVSKLESFVWLAVITSGISVMSDYLVDAMEGASKAWNMPMAFVSTILPPVGGNAAALSSSVRFAMKDKLDMSLGVAIGSSTQISMFVLPFCVLMGWMIGRPMDLNIQLFETATLLITIIVTGLFLQEGVSNYFKGLMLILCYLIVAASYFVHKDLSAPDKQQPKA